MSETDDPAGTTRPPEDARTDEVDREEEADREPSEEAEDREEEDRPTETRETSAGYEDREGELAGAGDHRRRVAMDRAERAERRHTERLEALRARADAANAVRAKALRHPVPTTRGIDLGGVDLSSPEGCGRAELAVLMRALEAPLIPPIWAREMSTLLRDRAEALLEEARRSRGEPAEPVAGTGGKRSRR